MDREKLRTGNPPVKEDQEAEHVLEHVSAILKRMTRKPTLTRDTRSAIAAGIWRSRHGEAA